MESTIFHIGRFIDVEFPMFGHFMGSMIFQYVVPLALVMQDVLMESMKFANCPFAELLFSMCGVFIKSMIFSMS